MDGIIQQFTGYSDGKSAYDFALGDDDVMGVFMMAYGNPANLLPFDTRRGLANKGIGLPNYKKPEQPINITTGLSKPLKYNVPQFTTHQLGSTSYDNLPRPQKHIPNIDKAKYNPDTEEVERRKKPQKSNKKMKKQSINSSVRREINNYLDGKKRKKSQKKINPQKTKQNKNNAKKYKIGNATINRTNKHKSKRDRVQQFINKHS